MSSVQEKMFRNRGNRIIRGNCIYSYLLIFSIVVVLKNLNMVGVVVEGFSLNSQSQVEQSQVPLKETSAPPKEQVKLSMRRRKSPSTNTNDNEMKSSNHIISIEFKEPLSRGASTAEARKHRNPATQKNAKPRTNAVQAGHQLQIPSRQAPKQANSIHSKITKKVSKKASRKVVEEYTLPSLPTSVSGSVPPSRRQPTTPVRLFDSRQSGSLTQHHSSKNVLLPLEKLAMVLESDSHSDSESHSREPASDSEFPRGSQDSEDITSSIEHSTQQRNTRITNGKKSREQRGSGITRTAKKNSAKFLNQYTSDYDSSRKTRITNAKKSREHRGSGIMRRGPRHLHVNQYTSDYDSSREAYERVRAALQTLRGTPQEIKGSADWFSGRRPAELAGIKLPVHPEFVWKKWWKSWPVFLSTAALLRTKLPGKSVTEADFIRAKQIVQAVEWPPGSGKKLRSGPPWREWSKSGEREGLNIPSDPPGFFAKWWVDWVDFLGIDDGKSATEEGFLQAKEFVQKVEPRLKTRQDWFAYCNASLDGKKRPNGKGPNSKDHQSPSKTPASASVPQTTSPQKTWHPFLPRWIARQPQLFYKEVGWVGWEDWLGAENFQPRFDFLPIEEARKVVQQLPIVGSAKADRKGGFKEDWMEYWRTKERPEGIPYCPYRHYKKKGTWTNWVDFLVKPEGSASKPRRDGELSQRNGHTPKFQKKTAGIAETIKIDIDAKKTAKNDNANTRKIINAKSRKPMVANVNTRNLPINSKSINISQTRKPITSSLNTRKAMLPKNHKGAKQLGLGFATEGMIPTTTTNDRTVVTTAKTPREKSADEEELQEDEHFSGSGIVRRDNENFGGTSDFNGAGSENEPIKSGDGTNPSNAVGHEHVNACEENNSSPRNKLHLAIATESSASCRGEAATEEKAKPQQVQLKLYSQEDEPVYKLNRFISRLANNDSTEQVGMDEQINGDANSDENNGDDLQFTLDGLQFTRDDLQFAPKLIPTLLNSDHGTPNANPIHFRRTILHIGNNNSGDAGDRSGNSKTSNVNIISSSAYRRELFPVRGDSVRIGNSVLGNSVLGKGNRAVQGSPLMETPVVDNANDMQIGSTGKHDIHGLRDVAFSGSIRKKGSSFMGSNRQNQNEFGDPLSRDPLSRNFLPTRANDNINHKEGTGHISGILRGVHRGIDSGIVSHGDRYGDHSPIGFPDFGRHQVDMQLSQFGNPRRQLQNLNLRTLAPVSLNASPNPYCDGNLNLHC